MDRRIFGRNLVFGALGLTAAPALAQYDPQGGPRDPQYGGRPPRPGMGPMGPGEQRYAEATLAVGGVSLRSSQLAQGRVRAPRVAEFADFEVAEQTTVAQVLGEMGFTPPPPAPMDQQMLDRLSSARGPDFERQYVMAQMDGHRRLLAIQERYIQEGRDPGARHVAMLARGQIKEHLKLLADIQQMRA